jgi:hypothetical protein
MTHLLKAEDPDGWHLMQIEEMPHCCLSWSITLTIMNTVEIGVKWRGRVVRRSRKIV